jgi:2-(3-amino-3-carboxypropyl)histidine synthase
MYTIDFESMIAAIEKERPKRIMIQLPDGLKQRALEIQQKLSVYDVEVLFWAGSNFGACDLPVGLEKLGVDMLFHLGHTEWVY